MVESVILKFFTKRQLPLSLEQIRKLCALVVLIIMLLMKTTLQIIFYEHVNSIQVGKTAASFRALVRRFCFNVDVLKYWRRLKNSLCVRAKPFPELLKDCRSETMFHKLSKEFCLLLLYGLNSESLLGCRRYVFFCRFIISNSAQSNSNVA